MSGFRMCVDGELPRGSRGHGLGTVPAHATGVAEAEVDVIAPVDIRYMRAGRRLDVNRKAARPTAHPMRRSAVEEMFAAARPGFGGTRVALTETSLFAVDQTVDGGFVDAGQRAIHAVFKSV